MRSRARYAVPMLTGALVGAPLIVSPAQAAASPGTLTIARGGPAKTLSFTGRYEGDHPLLQTCTQNNNMLTREAPSAVLWRPGASAAAQRQP